MSMLGASLSAGRSILKQKHSKLWFVRAEPDGACTVHEAMYPLPVVWEALIQTTY